MGDERPIVLVTGSSGFIASHVISTLLNNGNYRVRATEKSLAEVDAVEPVKKTFPDVELYEGDLSKDAGWKEAVAGCAYVHHIASPLPDLTNQPKGKEADEIVRTAVDGTIRVLEACRDAGTVKRVVLQSAISSISNGMRGNSKSKKDHVYTEADWTDPDEKTCSPYEKSKTYAEKAAWDFVNKLDDVKKFEFVVLNPAAVWGPVIYPRQCPSHELLVSVLTRQFPSVPDISMPIVDVRDVARAHLEAMTNEQAPGKRFVLWSDTVALIEVAKAYVEEFKSQGYDNIPDSVMGKFLLWTASLAKPGAKFCYSLLGVHLIYDNSKMKNDLHIEPMPWRKSAIDSAYSFIEAGLVEKKPGYKGQEK